MSEKNEVWAFAVGERYSDQRARQILTRDCKSCGERIRHWVYPETETRKPVTFMVCASCAAEKAKKEGW